MARINVARVINNPRFSQTFTVYRKTGSWVAGRFVQAETSIPMSGVVIPGGTKDVITTPEGDRISGLMVVYCTQQIFETRNKDTDKGTSDEIEWNSDRYRILKVLPWSDFGYYKVFGKSIGGD